MPINRDELLAKDVVRPPVEVSVPKWGSVLLRYPTFAEWYSITATMRECQASHKEPQADLIARLVAVVVSSPEGNRILSDAEAVRLLEKDFVPMMAVWARAWETVMRMTEADMEATEKN
jgi:hypothetical protein